MNTIVANAIAAEVAKLTREVDTPTEPFGYGSDLSCAADLTEDMVELDGDDSLVLAQALIRRLDCPRGALPDDPDYGIDVRGYLNRGTTTTELIELASRIRAELAKDDRVSAIAVTVTPSSTGSSLTVTLAVTPIDADAGGFTLTLAVTSAEVLIEELR